jgi:pimeloyl-ACP methyl ester carboxylesterase
MSSAAPVSTVAMGAQPPNRAAQPPIDECPPTPSTERHSAQRRPAASPRRTLRVITKDGVSLAARDFGARRPHHTVVFLHGLCLNSSTWAQQINRLLRQHGPQVRVISYDHRGHGRSTSAPMSSYSIDQLADDFAQVLRVLNVTGPLTVVAHSMGGMTVLAYLNRPASQRPVDPTGLVLVATAAGKLAERGLGRLLAAPGAAALLHLAAHTPEHVLRGLIKPVCATLSRAAHRVQTATLASVTLTALTTTPPGTALGFLTALRTYDLYPTLTAIRAQTTIISGAVDPITPQAHARDLATAIPDALHISVPNAGHMLPQQAPQVIDRAIQKAIALKRVAPNLQGIQM